MYLYYPNISLIIVFVHCVSSVCTSHHSNLSRGREVALRNSPSQLVAQLKASSSGCDIVVAVAQNDSPEFRKQSEDYFKVRQRKVLRRIMKSFNSIQQVKNVICL